MFGWATGHRLSANYDYYEWRLLQLCGMKWVMFDQFWWFVVRNEQSLPAEWSFIIRPGPHQRLRRSNRHSHIKPNSTKEMRKFRWKFVDWKIFAIKWNFLISIPIHKSGESDGNPFRKLMLIFVAIELQGDCSGRWHRHEQQTNLIDSRTRTFGMTGWWRCRWHFEHGMIRAEWVLEWAVLRGWYWWEPIQRWHLRKFEFRWGISVFYKRIFGMWFGLLRESPWLNSIKIGLFEANVFIQLRSSES